MNRIAKAFGFWCCFALVCAMWLSSTACPENDWACFMESER